MSTARENLKPGFDRTFWSFGIGLLFLVVALLVGPRLPDNQQAAQCVFNVRLPGPFGISLNCDSPEFMRLAHEPSALLEPLNARQSRPGLIAVAAALAWALSPLANLADKLSIKVGPTDINPQRIANALADDKPAYLAYTITNVAILLAAFYFFRRTCAAWGDESTSSLIIIVAVGLLLVANDVVKTFVWSPHTQMFNIFVPVFALYASMRANAGALIERRFAIFIGVATGLGVTAYPLFIIVLPCVAVCAFIFALRHGSRVTWSQSAINFTMFAAFTFIPEALWFAFVRLKTGGFYQREMSRYHLVVWMLDAWHHGFGMLAYLWWSKLELLMGFAALQAIPLITILLGVVTLGLASRSSKRNPQSSFWPLVAIGVLVSTITAAFYASAGLIVPRLAYSIIPPLITVVGAVALAVTRHDYARRLILAYWCVAVAFGAVIYTIMKDGPYR
jgi:hypothetical protein